MARGRPTHITQEEKEKLMKEIAKDEKRKKVKIGFIIALAVVILVLIVGGIILMNVK